MYKSKINLVVGIGNVSCPVNKEELKHMIDFLKFVEL